MIIINSDIGSIFNFNNTISIQISYDCDKYILRNISNSGLQELAIFSHKNDAIETLEKIAAYYDRDMKVVHINNKMEDKYATDRT